MYEPIEIIEYKGFEIKIYCGDEYPESPREGANLGTMWCLHSRYNLGDTQDELQYSYSDTDEPAINALCEHIYYNVDECYKAIDFEFDDKGREWDGSFDGDEWQLNRIWKWIEKNLYFLPLYLYDHSGLSINTGGYHCIWDSGQVGFIYVTKTKVKKKFGWKKITKKREKSVYNILEQEVRLYDLYLQGRIYCYHIEKNDETGEITEAGLKYMLNEKAVIEWWTKNNFKTDMTQEEEG